jgi:hypothetical protein
MSSEFHEKLRAIKKRLYQTFVPLGHQPRTVAFIFGCQRSGTTMLSRTLRRDLHSKTYGERGLARGAARGSPTRLLPYEEIEKIFAQERAPFLVAKPLVESQHSAQLLDRFPGSKGFWLYRHYCDVASSTEKMFGREASVYNLSALFDKDLTDHWFGERVPAEIRDTVRPHFDTERSVFDLHALCWWVRNSLYFRLEIDQDPRVLLCRYEDLTSRPKELIASVYRHLEIPYPGDYLVSDIHTRSVGKGSRVELAPEIETLCADLLARLDSLREACTDPPGKPVAVVTP